jgi:hypothetical protein
MSFIEISFLKTDYTFIIIFFDSKVKRFLIFIASLHSVKQNALRDGFHIVLGNLKILEQGMQKANERGSARQARQPPPRSLRSAIPLFFEMETKATVAFRS